MRVRSKEATGAALADAFATIEDEDKRVKTVSGPKHLLDQIRSWKRDIFDDHARTLWLATLTEDESLDGLYVSD